MMFLLYLILIILPLPLFGFIIKRRHYVFCLPPFVAFLGIYIFDIIGSIEVIKDEMLFSYAYYASLFLIIILFYLFYLFLLSYKRRLCIDWSDIHPSSISSFIPVMISLWAYSLFMLYLYTQRHGLPAVFSINPFGYNNIYAIRGEKSTNLSEGFQWYSVAWDTIPAFIFIYTYILKKLNNTKITRLLFYFNLPLVLFFSSLTLHKTPFAYLILYILLVNFLLKGKPLGFKKLLKYFVATMVPIILMLRLYLLDRSWVDVISIVPSYLYHRICVTYTVAHAYIIQIFPYRHDFFDGAAFGNPGHLLPYDPVNLSQFLGYWVHGRLENFSAPSFSQGYANFGYFGFLLIIFFMFLQIVLMQIIFKKSPRTPNFLTLYILLIPKLLGYATTSIQSVFSEIFILFAIAVLTMYYFNREAFRTDSKAIYKKQ